MSGRNPMEEAYKRLRQVAQQNAGRGFGGGMPQAPRGFGLGLGALIAIGGGLFVFQNALFNVDGGHRAIKYRRISGVSPEIYSEGAPVCRLSTPSAKPPSFCGAELTRNRSRRNPFNDPLV